ncbi:crAss001_48 related protein [Enterobacter hormaechei]
MQQCPATEIFSRLPQVDRNMLIKQLDAMKAYELILRARIARF